MKRLHSICRLLALAIPAFMPLALEAIPEKIGDLDEDGRYSIRDVAKIVNHLQRIEFLPQSSQPFADTNEDGNIDRRDVDRLIAVILEQDTIDTIPFSRPVATSPANGEGSVALTRETVVRFSLPLDDTVVFDQDNFYATFGGEKILSRVEISSDRLKATLFYLENLPDSARVRVTMDGSGVLDNLGREVDMDQDGEAGGSLVFDFDTATVTPVPSTGVIGTVYTSATDELGNNVPLQGVIIEIVGDEENSRTVTAADGTFRLEPVPAGRFFVNIDGRMVTGQYPDGAYYPFVGKTWEAIAGNPDNLANETGEIFLPLVSAGSLQPVSSIEETTVVFAEDVLNANPELAGTEVMVPANALFSNDGTRGGRVGIAPVAPDRLPEPLPLGLNLPMVITIQTDGATNFDVPVPVRLPNLPDPVTGERLGPGEATALWSFDHDTGQWEIAGPMTVTPDGEWVVTDPGVGVRQPGWHGRDEAADGKGGGTKDPKKKKDPNDIDGDGIPNDEDPDDDNDGIPDEEDPDMDGDQIPNDEDDDVDGDGKKNDEDDDDDGDGIPDGLDNDDDNDGVPDNCVKECLTTGSLSNLGVSVEGDSTVCKGEIIRFQADGVVDSGGTRLVTCRDEMGNITETYEEPVPEGAPAYDWTIVHNGTVVASGRGPVASTKAKEAGVYTVRFVASVARDCAPEAVDLEQASVSVVERGEFNKVSVGIDAPDPPTALIQKIEDTLNKIPRVSVELKPSLGLGLEGGVRDCCINGEFREDGERYSKGSLTISGSIEGKIYGPPTIDFYIDLKFFAALLKIDAGVGIDSSLNFGGALGKRVNDCKPSENCLFAAISASIEMTTKVKFEVRSIVEVFGKKYSLADINFQIKAPLKVGVKGSLAYNSEDACEGFKGSLGIDDITLLVAIQITDDIGISFERTIFKF
ncbi:MAG: dockerin type I domain-containing protein [Puniceicoccaceae bacterium]